jgi:hypothetical protein
MASASVKRHWSRLANMGCIVHGGCPAQIAHCHNGSVRIRMQEPKAKGKKLPRYDWLTLPLCPQLHAELDANVRAWELKYGPQAAFLDLVADILDIDLWALASKKPTP